MTENLMRNTLEPNLSLCDYAFPNLSVGYGKSQSSLREFIWGKGKNTPRNKLLKGNICLHSPIDTYWRPTRLLVWPTNSKSIGICIVTYFYDCQWNWSFLGWLTYRYLNAACKRLIFLVWTQDLCLRSPSIARGAVAVLTLVGSTSYLM